MFSSIAKRYEMANSVLSLGIDKLWRKKLISILPDKTDSNVLDLCTGTGDLLKPLGKKFKNVIGVDFCFPMIKEGKRYTNNLAQGDALSLPFKNETFDLVTVAFGVRNFENLTKGLSEINRVLKPDGKLFILEFGSPKGFFGYVYRLYSKVFLPFIGGLVTGNQEAYKYLEKTSSEFPYNEVFLEYLEKAKFNFTKPVKLTFGVAYIYRATCLKT